MNALEVTGIGLAVLAAIASAVAAFAALQAVRTAAQSTAVAERGNLASALMDIHSTYWSVEMLDAIISLNRVADGVAPEQLEARYEETLDGEMEQLQQVPAGDRIAYLRTTLHHKRRLVSHFYNHLAFLLEHRILEEEIIFTDWQSGDLRIVAEILLPIEGLLGEKLDTGADTSLLRKLYDRCLDYEKRAVGQR